MRKLLHKVFNRIVIISIIVAIQVAFFVLELVRFSNRAIYISSALKILSIVVVFFIIYKRNTNPAVKLAFVVPILLFPLLGGILYILWGQLFLPHKIKKNLDKTQKCIESAFDIQNGIVEKIWDEDPDIATQCKYIQKYAPALVWGNTSTKYYSNGKDYWADLLEALNSAEKYIFIEYFIIGLGKMWDPILEILRKKVDDGVEVRLIYDDFGSATVLPSRYYETLESYGIKCIAFNRIIPFFATILNNRDHRKNVVIDGKVSFTGGINIADEYIGEKERFGHWKDAGLRLSGDAVWNMTVLFLQMWNISKFTDEDFSVFKADNAKNLLDSDQNGYVLPYGDTPLDHELVAESVYLNMINNAKSYLWIYTPYLIMDDILTESIKLACKRGVDVRIVTPGIPDKKIVYSLTRYSYAALMEAGATIYEYTPGFIHSKCTLADDEIANIGTVNYDYRSLYHHFECGVLLYKNDMLKDLKEDMLNTFEQCTIITPQTIKKRRIRFPILGPILQLFAPLF